MKRKLAVLLAVFSIVVIIAVPANAFNSGAGSQIISPLTHGLGG